MKMIDDGSLVCFSDKRDPLAPGIRHSDLNTIAFLFYYQYKQTAAAYSF